MYDFIWLDNAYTACNLQKPWGFWPSLCYLTEINTCYWTTGILFSDVWPGTEKFHGSKHNALDDCKHQVRMLVKAINFQKEPTAGLAVQEGVRKAPTEVEEPKLSGTAINVLNRLLETFCNSTAQVSGTFETLALGGPTPVREVESTLEKIANLMKPRATSWDESNHTSAMEAQQKAIDASGIPRCPAPSPRHRRDRRVGGPETRFSIASPLSDIQSVPTGRVPTEPPNKRMKLTLGEENEPPPLEVENEKFTSISQDHGRPPRTPGISGLTDAKTIEEISDYGDNSDLDEFFHSFSA